MTMPPVSLARSSGRRLLLVLAVPAVLFATGCSSADDAEGAPAPAAAADAGPPPSGPLPTHEEQAPSEADPGAADAGLPVPNGDFVDPGDKVVPSVLAHYTHLDPTHLVAKKLLDHAVMFFEVNKTLIPNQSVMTIVDFTKHSGKQRFYVIDMKTGVVTPAVVAHGKMSDPDYTGYATKFSNVEGSNMSSLGFVLTGATYTGVHGRSLRLNGLSPTNSNMFDRAIVIHGASYVVEGQAKQGRSLGCFALDEDEKDAIIDRLKDGSLLYADLGG